MSSAAPREDERVLRTVARLREAAVAAPPVAVILGSGWGALADQVGRAQDLPYQDLPAFPAVSVGGHQGLLRLGQIGPQRVAVLMGRQHGYETGEVDGMRGAIRSLAAWGCRILVQTNAAGSLEPAFAPGECMLITDHLNLVQRSPLFGIGGDERFVDLAQAYDPALRTQALARARGLGWSLHEGVYAWQMGPQFETPAEIRMLRLLGAQAVGMSTVPETILARHVGLRVLALSLLTNYACGLSTQPLSHAQTLAVAQASAARASALAAAIITALEA